MGRTGIRAVAIVIKDNKILLMHRTRDGKQYWVFPGGGVKEDEKVENAVVREITEEASLKVEIIKLLYSHKYSDIGHKQFFYLCKYTSGKPKLGNFNELQAMKDGDQTYKPMWVDIKQLPKLLLYPLEIRDWVIKDLKTGFKNTPRTAILETKDLRQAI